LEHGQDRGVNTSTHEKSALKSLMARCIENINLYVSADVQLFQEHGAPCWENIMAFICGLKGQDFLAVL